MCPAVETRSLRLETRSLRRASSLCPNSDRDEHEKDGERFLELRTRQTLRQPCAEPRADKKSESNPQRRDDVEVPAPVVLPRAERAHWQEQGAERCPRRHLRCESGP